VCWSWLGGKGGQRRRLCSVLLLRPVRLVRLPALLTAARLATARLATARLATAAVANMSDEMRVKRQKGATKDSKGAKGSEWKWERGQPAFP